MQSENRFGGLQEQENTRPRVPQRLAIEDNNELISYNERILRLRQLNTEDFGEPNPMHPHSGVKYTTGGNKSKRESVGTHLWAIVVGVDYYDDGATLTGCIHDAQLVVEYLTEDLHVPPSHIIALTSSAMDKLSQPLIGQSGRPTRAAILDALHDHFRDNDAIKYGDNMFFSFSGLGSLYGESDGSLRTMALCPMDRDLRLNSSSYVCDISDRELDAIFSEIRDSKGANLTTIFDCSHSPSSSVRTRSSPHMYDLAAEQRMFTTAESDPRRRRQDSPSLSSSSWKADTTSHVSLAACQPHEMAREVTLALHRYHTFGLFTYTLVAALRSPLGWSPAMTYHRLVKDVMKKSDLQTFVVAGERVHSRLWFKEGEVSKPVVTIRGTMGETRVCT